MLDQTVNSTARERFEPAMLALREYALEATKHEDYMAVLDAIAAIGGLLALAEELEHQLNRERHWTREGWNAYFNLLTSRRH